MKLTSILISAIILFSTLSKAAVTEVFKKDYVVFNIEGTDLESNQLFDAMLVKPTVSHFELLKHIKYENIFSDLVFDLVCLQTIETQSTSCRLKLFSNNTIIDSERKYVRLNIRDQMSVPHSADTFAKMFFNNIVDSNRQADVFLSADKKLRLWKTYNEEGKVVLFNVEYK